MEAVKAVIERLEAALPVNSPTEPDADQPRVPVRSDYILTRLQEDRLIDHANLRFKELRDEQGRECARDNWYNDTTMEAGTIQDRSQKHLSKRHRYWLTYQNNWEWRAKLLGGLFAESNLNIPLSRRICRQMVARANNYFFGTDPYFATYPVGPSDVDIADKAEAYIKHQAERASLKPVAQRAVENAFVQGECVVKTMPNVLEQSFYRRTETILVLDGDPVLAADGDYITDKDAWIPAPTPAPVDTPEGAPEPPTAATTDQVTPQVVLKRDQQTASPPGATWDTRPVDRRIVHYEGPKASIRHFADFLCPLRAKNIQEADCCIDIYDLPLTQLVDFWINQGVITLDQNVSRVEETKALIAVLRSMISQDGQPKALANQTGSQSKEEPAGQSEKDAVLEVAEYYLRWDANEDGVLENIVLVMDQKNGIPLFYDYIENVTTAGTRPFDVVRINPVEGSWTGIGAIEMFENAQNAADVFLNRLNHSQSKSGCVVFWKPQGTYEGERNPRLKLNWGQTYTLKEGQKMEDVLNVTYLRDIKSADLNHLLELFLQIAMNESGVQHANDSYMAGMDSAKLATGVRNVEMTGQEMFGLYLSHLIIGLQAVLQRFSQETLAHIDADTAVTIWEGDDQVLLNITPAEVRDFDMDVEILLTRYRNEQKQLSAMQATTTMREFYSDPPEFQVLSAALYRDQLRSLEIPNADELIVPGVLMIPPPAPKDSSGAPGAGPSMPGEAKPNL